MQPMLAICQKYDLQTVHARLKIPYTGNILAVHEQNWLKFYILLMQPIWTICQ